MDQRSSTQIRNLWGRDQNCKLIKTFISEGGCNTNECVCARRPTLGWDINGYIRDGSPSIAPGPRQTWTPMDPKCDRGLYPRTSRSQAGVTRHGSASPDRVLIQQLSHICFAACPCVIRVYGVCRIANWQGRDPGVRRYDLTLAPPLVAEALLCGVHFSFIFGSSFFGCLFFFFLLVAEGIPVALLLPCPCMILVYSRLPTTIFPLRSCKDIITITHHPTTSTTFLLPLRSPATLVTSATPTTTPSLATLATSMAIIAQAPSCPASSNSPIPTHSSIHTTPSPTPPSCLVPRPVSTLTHVRPMLVGLPRKRWTTTSSRESC